VQETRLVSNVYYYYLVKRNQNVRFELKVTVLTVAAIIYIDRIIVQTVELLIRIKPKQSNILPSS
jgi:hypothetical protein